MDRNKKIKVLNLYAGIGGNRKLWTDCEVTAIEINPEIAAIYQDFYPDDIVIITDAHQYLLEHFKEFDFIWSSPPCQSNSITNRYLNIHRKPKYPDLTLYQQYIFLMHFFKGKFVIENVKPYYNPLIPATSEHYRHLFWSNFRLPKLDIKSGHMTNDTVKVLQKLYSIDISKYKIKNRKDQILRNCVHPHIGKYIFDRARNIQIEENTPHGKLIFPD